MATTQTFQTVVSLNAQQAKNELAALQKTLEDLKKKKTDALRDSKSTVKDIREINKEIKSAEAMSMPTALMSVILSKPLTISLTHQSVILSVYSVL